MNEELIQKNLAARDSKSVEAALRFLEKSGNLSHIKIIMDKLQGLEDKYLKSLAAKAAAAIIRRNLTENYGDLNAKMRGSLAQILKTLDPAVIDNIALGLQSTNQDIRFNAIRVLGLMGKNPKVKDLLKNLITDRNEMVRATSISLLKEMMENADVQLIATLLNDKDNRVVANCIECIESLNHDRLSPLLLRFKSHSNNRIRANALKALWKLNYCDVFPDIKSMCENRSDFLMRASACWVIGECAKNSDFRFVELLSSLNKDEEKLVRQNVLKAQFKIGGEDLLRKMVDEADPKEILEAKKLLDG